jgi:hypothetical protein
MRAGQRNATQRNKTGGCNEHTNTIAKRSVSEVTVSVDVNGILAFGFPRRGTVD